MSIGDKYIVLFLIIAGLLLLFLCILGIISLFNLFRCKKEGKDICFCRHNKNPILEPHNKTMWEAEGVFNPGAYLDKGGFVHLLYRAVGSDGISRLGHARVIDSVHCTRSKNPVFSLKRPRAGVFGEQALSFSMYPSGGSWGGAEDPRIVNIDGRIYVTFNAFDGWDFLRIGVTSISEKDFLNQDWRWNEPMMISPVGQIHKNWVLFPEKIKGKFAILHSISPTIQIDFVDKLEDLANGKASIASKFKQLARNAWDSSVRGAGPPPIKTDKGWLLIYHATDKREPHKYKIGAMLLDLENPKKVIARSPSPLFSPEEWYENDGKPGVVYTCGAVVKDGRLDVYYGGGDKRIGVASINLGELISWLLAKGRKFE